MRSTNHDGCLIEVQIHHGSFFTRYMSFVGPHTEMRKESMEKNMTPFKEIMKTKNAKFPTDGRANKSLGSFAIRWNGLDVATGAWENGRIKNHLFTLCVG